jgi:Cu(I)/Ag(I) efflux system membrane fusion protein/cobalt-zinc-cadmium efflux system membrane fusion protein
MRRAAWIVAAVIALVAAGAVFVAVGGRDRVASWRRGGASGQPPAPAVVSAPNRAAPAGVQAPPRVPVTLDARRQQLIGVRTARAVRLMVAPEVRAVGTVRADETRQTEVNVKADGWIRDLQADFTGRPVRRGETLFTLYSPDLIATQEEYLLAIRGQTQAISGQVPELRDYSTRLVEAARERLRRWDLGEAEIQELEQRGAAFESVPIRSPASGVIVEKTAIEGMHVAPGQTLFRIADLSVVWVEADVYERDMAVVRVGQAATVTLDAYPDQRFAGRATYIHPFVEEQTRTMKVRFEFPNPRGLLKPGMYANVELVTPASSALAVPAEAVLDSGREQVVFVALGDGYFEPRRVRVGRRVGTKAEITEGLEEGEEVATGATFFLDSESQLQAVIRGFEPPPGVPPAAAAADAQPGLTIALRSDPDPPRTGDALLEVSVRDPAGAPVTDAEVLVMFFMAAMPAMNMPAMKNGASLQHVGGGIYRGTGQWLMAGRWDVTITVTRRGQRLASRQMSMVAR